MQEAEEKTTDVFYNDNGYEKDYENPAHITVLRMEAEK